MLGLVLAVCGLVSLAAAIDNYPALPSYHAGGAKGESHEGGYPQRGGDGGYKDEGAVLGYGASKYEKESKYYYGGQYKGTCNGDGLYYKDDTAFVMCSNGYSHQQACPPGTRTSGFPNYKAGYYYGYTDLCSVNLVDLGYGPDKYAPAGYEERGAYGGTSSRHGGGGAPDSYSFKEKDYINDVKSYGKKEPTTYPKENFTPYGDNKGSYPEHRGSSYSDNKSPYSDYKPASSSSSYSDRQAAPYSSSIEHSSRYPEHQGSYQSPDFLHANNAYESSSRYLSKSIY